MIKLKYINTGISISITIYTNYTNTSTSTLTYIIIINYKTNYPYYTLYVYTVYIPC